MRQGLVSLSHFRMIFEKKKKKKKKKFSRYILLIK